jgi:hypothetical protein
MQHLKSRFFIDPKLEHIRTSVVANYVQIELSFGDLAGIKLGGKDGSTSGPGTVIALSK